MEAMYSFHDLHETVKYGAFYDFFFFNIFEEFHANCSISKSRK